MQATDLPNDVEALKAYIALLHSDFSAQLQEKNRILQEKDVTIQEKDRQILWEREKLRALQMRYFGHSSEKQHIEKDAQYFLFDEAESHATDDSPPGNGHDDSHVARAKERWSKTKGHSASGC